MHQSPAPPESVACLITTENAMWKARGQEYKGTNRSCCSSCCVTTNCEQPKQCLQAPVVWGCMYSKEHTAYSIYKVLLFRRKLYKCRIKNMHAWMALPELQSAAVITFGNVLPLKHMLSHFLQVLSKGSQRWLTFPFHISFCLWRAKPRHLQQETFSEPL